jgi:Ca-activated chloride channel family protein
MKRTRVLLPLLLALSLGVTAPGSGFADWWLTRDQQGQRLLDAGNFAVAAERFADPLRKGVALFRAGEFEQAAAVFGRIASAEAAYNRGNALVMRGKYEDAVQAYDRALALRPGFEDASVNREIARLRAERVKKEGGEMTGGELGADEITFEKGKTGGGEEQVEGETETLSDAEMRAVWLRRVKTRPADFMRAKFAYQLAKQQAEAGP